MADKLKKYSLVIAWDDTDREQGTYGATVRARGHEHAERIVRARMAWSHWENYRDQDQSRRESLRSYLNHDGSYFGSVLECSEGAIWQAVEMEAALREVAEWADLIEQNYPEMLFTKSVRKVLAEIDGIN